MTEVSLTTKPRTGVRPFLSELAHPLTPFPLNVTMTAIFLKLKGMVHGIRATTRTKYTLSISLVRSVIGTDSPSLF